MAQPESSTLRHFVAYVEDQPGVLNRVSSLFRRRCYNIVSLNVGRTHEAGVSRMTFAVEADQDTARRIEANLYKLVNVLSVEDITDKPNLARGLALIKVTVGPEKRSEVLQLCDVFRARAVDVGTGTLIVEITGDQSKIDGLVAILLPFGIAEMVQTGTVAMTRGVQGDAASGATQQPPNLRGVFAA
jgi:acetolactate synthase-1/3 small subunit